MSSIFEYYQQEMRYLRKSVAAFSQAYPEVAGELKLSAGRSNDPDIEQLLQSFAYMTGQLRADLHNQRDQIPNQLLHGLYPNLMRSIPCMTVLQANVEDDGANFVNGYTFEKGRMFTVKAERKTRSGQKQSVDVQFANCYNTPLWPFDIDTIKVMPRNYFSFLDKRADTQSVMSIAINNRGSESIEQYPIEKLRFYICDALHRADIYQLLCDKLVGCAIKVGDKVKVLDKAKIHWVGFDRDENVLPDDAGTHRPYRLLQELFAFSEKFYFFDLEGLDVKGVGNRFELLFMLNEPSKAVTISKSSFALNCFPVINLFDKSFKPIQLKQNQHEYRVLADERYYMQAEVHSIKEVRSISYTGQSKTVSAWLGNDAKPTSGQYYISRLGELLEPGERGCDTFISIYDANFAPSQPVDQTIAVKGVCNNRRLPEGLRVEQKLQLIGAGPMLSAQVMEIPTRFRGPSLDGENNIKLLSQLSLNLHALAGGNGPELTAEQKRQEKAHRIELLRQLLYLYCDPMALSHTRQIDGLSSMDSEAVVKRIGRDMWRGHCRGTRIKLTINEDYFDGANPLLLGSVLSHFFGLYTTINHFVQLQLCSDKREGVWKQWQPRIGEQVIL